MEDLKKYYPEDLLNNDTENLKENTLEIPSGDLPYYLNLKIAHNKITGIYDYGIDSSEKKITEPINDGLKITFGNKSGKIYEFDSDIDSSKIISDLFKKFSNSDRFKDYSNRFKNNFNFHQKIFNTIEKILKEELK